MLERASKRNIKEYPQMICFAHDTISRKIFIDGLFEKRELEVLKVFLQKELTSFNTCLDIGANIGNHSILLSKFFKKVTSFEPQKEVFEVLKLNTRKIKNILPINKGLSDIEKQENIKIPKNKRGMGSLVYDFPENSYYNELINLITYLKVKVLDGNPES